jgi:peptidyl-dipeptidase A
MHAFPLTLLALLGAVAVSGAGQASSAPTRAEAEAFVARAEARLEELTRRASRAAWVQQNFITEDTTAMAADAQAELTAANMELAQEAASFSSLELPAQLERKLQILKLLMVSPAPRDPAAQREQARLTAEMEGLYGKGRYCPPGGGECLDVDALSAVLAESRDPGRLLEAWRGWRTVAPPLRPLFERFVELGNLGARELGFADLGAMWRSNYDMPPDEFSRELDRLWAQVRPLYEALHAHVRARLHERYGSVVPARGPIPAHVLGNMWSQDWSHVYELVGPEASAPGFDLTELLRARGVDPVGMVRYGERFFTSLGFARLPPTFWERSLFTRPRDREVVCHASAWDVNDLEDLRIKMCIEVDAEDFVTVHHELGHNFYQRAYNLKQPFLFRDSANDGFHEAIGDAVALSVTPGYLVQVGLLDAATGEAGDIGLLLRMALERIAFLPFGLLVDEWRFGVFSGEVSPAEYNAAWWELRERLQGISPPVPRSEDDFDPGAKYHVPANTPYTRYFLAHLLQFQLHRAMCREAGATGPLHRCSVYGSRQAGDKLNAMLEMGRSRPWPEALEAMTGERRIDAGALLEYFEPLSRWLEEQNRGRPVGW